MDIKTRKILGITAIGLALVGGIVANQRFNESTADRSAKCAAANGQREACLEMIDACILLERKTCEGADCTASRIECRARIR